MDRHDHWERLLADIDSTDDAVVVAAAMGLLELGEYGTPVGTYLLKGGKAAIRVGRLADAVVMLYHGLKVVEPQTVLWAEMIVNRAIGCAHHGFCADAIDSAQTFLAAVGTLPSAAARFVPYAHHAIALACDRLQEYEKAVEHCQLAVATYSNPVQRAQAQCDLAFALALCNQADDAEAVLAQVDPETLSGKWIFGYYGAQCLMRYIQGRYAEAMAAGSKAESLAVGHEDTWGAPLADIHYWMSRAAWELGDRYRSAALALHAAVSGDRFWNLPVSRAASEWLAEIMQRGGIRSA